MRRGYFLGTRAKANETAARAARQDSEMLALNVALAIRTALEEPWFVAPAAINAAVDAARRVILGARR